MTRRVVLGVALAFTALFAALTLDVIVRTGLDILTLTSLCILVLLGVGLFGALMEPPEE
jgi:hypothetical protein